MNNKSRWFQISYHIQNLDKSMGPPTQLPRTYPKQRICCALKVPGCPPPPHPPPIQ